MRSFTAHRCPSYQHFLAGRCFKCSSGNCAIMGYHATLPKFQSANSSENEIFPSEMASDAVTPVPGKYFLATGRDFPFCRECYRFLIIFPSNILTKSLWSVQNVTIDSQLNWRNLVSPNDGSKVIWPHPYSPIAGHYGASIWLKAQRGLSMAPSIKLSSPIRTIWVIIYAKSSWTGRMKWMYWSRDHCVYSGATTICTWSRLWSRQCKCHPESKLDIDQLRCTVEHRCIFYSISESEIRNSHINCAHQNVNLPILPIEDHLFSMTIVNDDLRCRRTL